MQHLSRSIALMTYRIPCVILLTIVAVTRVNAQTGTTSQPQSAKAAADFPDEPSSDERGRGAYVAGYIGMSVTSDTTAPTGDAEGGFRASKHVSVLGGYGFVRNLQPSTLQPYVDIVATQMATRNIGVSGEGVQPAQYAWGGVRFDVPTSFHVSPYVMAGAGWAWSTPSAQFTYTAGSATVNGGTAAAGQDATADVLSSGVFVGDSWNAIMFRWAAGLSIPVRGGWGVDARYNWSRMFAPDTVTTHGLTAGLTFRF